MFIFNIAYRHLNNEVEGFTGCGFSSKNAARIDAVRLIVAKCDAIGQRYDPSRLIEQPEGLTREEKQLIFNDFKLSQRKQ
jgi:hypothetical protein